MDNKEYIKKASNHLQTLCNVKPNRRTGSLGNRKATAYFAEIVKKLGYAVDADHFSSLDYKCGQVSLTSADKKFTVHHSPYSLGCDIKAEMVAVSNVEELAKISCKNKILLLKDEICSEQLMPKNFVFYNPELHKKIYFLLEQKQPKAIITATAKKPELVGALYPFPLIVDGDFNIPSVYCTDVVGKEIAAHSGDMFKLIIQAERIPSTARARDGSIPL